MSSRGANDNGERSSLPDVHGAGRKFTDITESVRSLLAASENSDGVDPDPHPDSAKSEVLTEGLEKLLKKCESFAVDLGNLFGACQNANAVMTEFLEEWGERSEGGGGVGGSVGEKSESESTTTGDQKAGGDEVSSAGGDEKSGGGGGEKSGSGEDDSEKSGASSSVAVPVNNAPNRIHSEKLATEKKNKDDGEKKNEKAKDDEARKNEKANEDEKRKQNKSTILIKTSKAAGDGSKSSKSADGARKRKRSDADKEGDNQGDAGKGRDMDGEKKEGGLGSLKNTTANNEMADKKRRVEEGGQ